MPQDVAKHVHRQLELHIAKLASTKPAVYRKEFLSHPYNFKYRASVGVTYNY